MTRKISHAFAQQPSLSLATFASALFALTGIAHAYASAWSGWIRWAPDVFQPGIGTTQVWLNSRIDYCTAAEPNCNNQPPNNWGYIQVQFLAPTGWIGTEVAGFMNGGICGWRDSYSNKQTNQWSDAWRFCANPSGVQNFRTGAYGWIWDGSRYQGRGWQSSPSWSN